MTDLSIAMGQDGDKRILRLSGQVDAHTLASLEQEIEHCFEKMHLKLLLNFTQVDAISDEALKLLFKETKKFKNAKGYLGISDVSSSLMQIIINAGLDQGLFIYRSELEALKAMA